MVKVDCELPEASDWSVFGDWIGSQIPPSWDFPFGPMPYITGLSSDADFEQRKALTAAAANFGCPMLWAHGLTQEPTQKDFVGELVFTKADLEARYAELAPTGQVDLVVIGCPQASLGEVRSTASLVRSHMEMGQRIPEQRLWVFTSSYIYDLAAADGSIDLLEEAGALVLKDTCPEVTPYNRNRYNHLLTKSMKAEHYLTSGLNRLPTSVARLSDCVAHAFDATLSAGPTPLLENKAKPQHKSTKVMQTSEFSTNGRGLPSQNKWTVRGKALVSDVPITYLGYVNTDSGVVEETGHPLDGCALEGRVLIYPKGSGSTVAPYVLMGLVYTGKGPLAIINRDVCSLTLPACSLLGLPYGHGFEEDPCMQVNDGDEVELSLIDGIVSLKVIERV